ncbi:MAG: aspartyl/glutamyl-tRNA amidotransferase subunit C, partial [Oscillospiraceae bacterium]|nr:aspartyl/glutamyl-tRNA amidotransferase subunit C [Oscillospiraceae bacterium]
MKIDVKHIAGLARLRFSEEELAQLEKEMISLAEMVRNLPDHDNGSYSEQRIMELRPDIPEKGKFSAGEILSNAPD